MAKSSQETRRIHQGASFIIASTQSTLGFSGTNQGLGRHGFPSLHACGVFLFLLCVPWDALFLLCPTVATICYNDKVELSYKQSLEKGALFIAKTKLRMVYGLGFPNWPFALVSNSQTAKPLKGSQLVQNW